jgi:lysophospholipid acyltransferase (LPLAT)-like uncharacterized protein
LGFTNRLKFFVIRMLGSLLLLALGSTWRLRMMGTGHVRSVRARGLRPIYSFWHGRQLALAYSHRYSKIQIMISEHGDGEMIAQVTDQLGFGSVRGSTTRGGMRALRALARKTRAGFDVAITPDGPRGPRHVLQPGAIAAAMITGCPLVPATVAAWPRWNFRSWDRFMVPRPFADVIVLFGEPMYVPSRLSEAGREEYRERFERRMIELVEAADRMVRPGGK